MRRPKNLTRMNHDHDDCADLFRGHLNISAPNTFLVFGNANDRLPGGRERQWLRSQSASSS